MEVQYMCFDYTLLHTYRAKGHAVHNWLFRCTAHISSVTGMNLPTIPAGMTSLMQQAFLTLNLSSQPPERSTWLV